MDELLWFVGLMEGEGYFGSCVSRGRHYPRVALAMTDRDVVERAQPWFGRPIYTDVRPGKQPIHRVAANGERAAALMAALRPYMGRRRAERIAEILAEKGQDSS